MDFFSFDFSTIFYSIAAMLLSSTVHEYAHAYTAHKLGDDTAKSEGRMSLNPLVHIDPMGLLMIVVARIGWSKPVPVNSYNFENPKVGNALVSIAGPISNVVLALISGLLLKFVFMFMLPSTIFGILVTFLYTMIIINVSLAIFNLLPIPPLDGSHIVELFIPRGFEETWDKIRQYAPYLIFLLFLPITPIFALFNEFWYNLLFTIVNLLTSLFGLA